MKKTVSARHKSAVKRARQNIKRRERNGFIKSSLRTAIKKVRVAIEKNNPEEAAAALKLTVPLIGQAVSKGIIVKNNGSRKVSRLTKLCNSLNQK